MAFLEDPLTRLRDLVSRFGLVFVFNRYYSLYRAKVITSTDPNNQGRVRVNCPAVSKTGVLDWAYPVSLMASGNRGLFFPPDKDDYVIVGFEEGNTKHPFYIGGWWKKDDLPEEFKHEDKEPPTVRGIVTPSGHKLIFTDTKDEEKIRLEHKNGSKLTFLTNKNIEVETPAGHKVTIDNDGKSITILDAEKNTVVMDKDGILLKDKSDQKVHLNGNGKTIVLSDDIEMGGSGPTDSMALAKLTRAEIKAVRDSLNSLVSKFNSHKHMVTGIQTAGAPVSHTQTAPVNTMAPGSTADSPPSVGEIKSANVKST